MIARFGRARRWQAGMVVMAAVTALSPISSSVWSPQTVAATTASATDESKIPHYYGPYNNYANSAQAMIDAVVEVVGGGGKVDDGGVSRH